MPQKQILSRSPSSDLFVHLFKLQLALSLCTFSRGALSRRRPIGGTKRPPNKLAARTSLLIDLRAQQVPVEAEGALDSMRITQAPSDFIRLYQTSLASGSPETRPTLSRRAGWAQKELSRRFRRAGSGGPIGRASFFLQECCQCAEGVSALEGVSAGLSPRTNQSSSLAAICAARKQSGGGSGAKVLLSGGFLACAPPPKRASLWPPLQVAEHKESVQRVQKWTVMHNECVLSRRSLASARLAQPKTPKTVTFFTSTRRPFPPGAPSKLGRQLAPPFSICGRPLHRELTVEELPSGH